MKDLNIQEMFIDVELRWQTTGYDYVCYLPNYDASAAIKLEEIYIDTNFSYKDGAKPLSHDKLAELMPVIRELSNISAPKTLLAPYDVNDKKEIYKTLRDNYDLIFGDPRFNIKLYWQCFLITDDDKEYKLKFPIDFKWKELRPEYLSPSFEAYEIKGSDEIPLNVNDLELIFALYKIAEPRLKVS